MNSESEVKTSAQDSSSLVGNDNQLKSFRTIGISKFMLANSESFKSLDGLTLIIDQDILENEQSQKISSLISNLTHLSFFAIDNKQFSYLGNRFGQYFSDGIGTLLEVQELNLNCCNSKISDTDVEYLFNKISLLINIQKLTLDFTGNYIQTRGAKHISNCLRQLRKITDLHFKFGTFQWKYFPLDILIVPISNLPFLKKLYLKFHSSMPLLSGTRQTTSYLKKMVNLTELSLILVTDTAQFSDEQSLMNSIEYLNNLEKLQFSTTYVDMKSEDLNNSLGYPIQFGLEKLSKLTSLDLEFKSRKIEEKIIFNLSQGIHYLSNLSILSLTLNYAIFTDESSKILGASFVQLKNLKQLKVNLSFARISDKNSDLLRGLEHLDNLTDLTLNFCNTKIDYYQMSQYFGYLSMLPKLIILNLSFSNSSMDIETSFHKLSQTISKLESLQQFRLNLLSIHLNSEDIKLFFTNLQKISSHLTVLFLDFWRCKIEPSSADNFSNGIANLKNLTSLGLCFYQIGYSLDWSPQQVIRIASLTNLNTFSTSLTTMKPLFSSNFSRLITNSNNLVNIKMIS